MVPDYTLWQWLLLAADLLVKFLALGIVPANRKPSSANAWLILIFLIPIIGIPLYWLFSSNFVSRRRHGIQQEANALIGRVQREDPDYPPTTELADATASLISLNRELTGFPAVHAQTNRLWADYEHSLKRLVDAVDSAQHYVHVEVYIQAWDHTTDVFYQALGRAVERGVEVRLMYDHIGSWKYPDSQKLGKRLSAIGVKWHKMLPLEPWRLRFRRPDLRNHRKIIVVDGEIGFLGSLNLIDRGYLMANHRRAGRQWIDAMVEVTGPIVTSLETVFAVDWYTESGERLNVERIPDLGPQDATVMQMLPSGPGYLTTPNLRMFNSMIHGARERLIICSPYFIPDEAMMEALTTACYRGVKVDLLVGEKADQFMVQHAQSSYYQQLLEAGVRIWQFPAPYILHTKFVVADPGSPDSVGAFGSSNLDIRSFELNYESTLLITPSPLLDDIAQLGDTYKSVSRELTLAEWNERGFWRRYIDNAMRLTSGLQ